VEARLDFLASNSVNRRPALKRPPPPELAASALSFTDLSCVNERCNVFSCRTWFSDREMGGTSGTTDVEREHTRRRPSLFPFFARA
jgi:hypothetical protein